MAVANISQSKFRSYSFKTILDVLEGLVGWLPIVKLLQQFIRFRAQLGPYKVLF